MKDCKALSLSQARLWWSLFAICEGINTLNKHFDPAHCIFGTLRHVWKCLKSIEIVWDLHITWPECSCGLPGNDESHLWVFLVCSNLIMPWPSHQVHDIPGDSRRFSICCRHSTEMHWIQVQRQYIEGHGECPELQRPETLYNPTVKNDKWWKCGLGIPNEPGEMNAHLSHLSHPHLPQPPREMSQQCHRWHDFAKRIKYIQISSNALYMWLWCLRPGIQYVDPNGF